MSPSCAHAAVERPARRAEILDLLVVRIGQVVGAGEDLECRVELIARIDVEAGIGWQVVDLTRRAETVADEHQSRLDAESGDGYDFEPDARFLAGASGKLEVGGQI